MIDFSTTLIHWYDNNKRTLPWRETNDAYLIWISETILQQTQIKTGLDYYIRITERFPNVQELATASEDELLKYWQGLGYYSRARNLHFTAKIITDEHNGSFPNSYKELLKLKGVGPYTAAAIASFAYNLPHAVVDGNVFRFLSRVFGISEPIGSTSGKRHFQDLADKLLNKKYPGKHNQAIMEIGSLICKPKLPVCDECPFKISCVAYERNIIHELPVKSKKLISTKRFLTYLYLHDDNNNVLIRKRSSNDIWKGLYEFPLIETPQQLKNSQLITEIDNLLSNGLDDYEIDITAPIEHKLTHRILNIQFIIIHKSDNILNMNSSINEFRVVPFEDLRNLAFPKPIISFLKKFRNLHV